ncbi:MAG: transglycosylase SLT domain-containing protein [Candidatus Delongbacteria bacterium]|nr:transglycosylase SLT domain-containing protein [Candidatus Delongbacteria bacterium]
MPLKNCNIVLWVIMLIIPFSYAQENSGTYDLHSLLNHANKLVREGNYLNASYFYEKIFLYLDSVEQSDDISRTGLDSLKETAENHFSNFENLVNSLCIKLDREEKLFIYDKKDFDLDGSGSEKFEYSAFPDKELILVKKWIENYNTNYRTSFQAYLNRSFDYIDDVRKVFRHFGLPEELAYIPMAESGYSPFAHSFAKAAGLWQFIPSTGAAFGLETNWWEDDRKNVIKSTVAAAKLYMGLYRQFEDWNLVLSAYNCGPGRVRSAIRKDNSDNFWRLISLPKETRDYVPRLRALITIAKDPVKYGFTIEKETALHDTVMLDSCVSLNVIAQCSGISYEEIKKLNPHLRQWLLPPYAKNYPVMIPAESKISFREKFSGFTNKEKYPVTVYEAEESDTFKKIAKKFKINITGITDLNSIADNEFHKGVKLKVIVPPSDQKWFTDFNNRYLTYYDEEEYFLEGRKKAHYIVRNGDSVWSISRKFNVNQAKLRSWNSIGKNNLIKPGQRLVVYL